jgi:carboxymethylenebutenolidase
MRIVLPSGTQASVSFVDKAAMGLVIAPDIFGLRPLFDDMVERLSREWQMSVIAVEPFPGQTLSEEIADRFAAAAHLDDELHLRDLTEAADYLGTSRVGLMGFCIGGMYCFKAGRSSRFDRIASFYGMIHVPEAWAGPGQGDPINQLRAGHPDRVLALIGTQDPYTPPDHVNELRAVGVSVREYPEAVHAFAHDPARPVHRPDDAADAFSATRNWLLGN